MANPTIYDPPRLIRGWTIQATCPIDGHLLEHIADGRPNGHTSRAQARCSHCGHQYAVEITIRDVTHRLGSQARRIGPQVVHPDDIARTA